MLRRFSTSTAVIVIQSPLHAGPYHGPLPNIRLTRYLPPLCNFLYGKHHERHTITGCGLVCSNGPWWLFNIHLRGPGAASPPRHDTHHNSRNKLDYCPFAFCNCPSRCKLRMYKFKLPLPCNLPDVSQNAFSYSNISRLPFLHLSSSANSDGSSGHTYSPR